MTFPLLLDYLSPLFRVSVCVSLVLPKAFASETILLNKFMRLTSYSGYRPSPERFLLSYFVPDICFTVDLDSYYPAGFSWMIFLT